MGSAIPNMALSATLYLFHRLHDPARSLNNGDALNLHHSAMKVLY